MRKQLLFLSSLVSMMLLLGLYQSLDSYAANNNDYDCETASAVVEEIAPGVHVRQGQHGTAFVDKNFANIGFIVGQQCVAVIDTGASLEEGQALRCAVEKTTPVPICYVITSHYHYDHAYGNLAFKSDTVKVIGHAKLAHAMTASADYYLGQLERASGQALSKELIVLPDQTVAIGEPMQLDLGGRSLRITAHPPAHTSTDLSVWDEQSGTLWLSDLLFLEHIPTLDGSINGWLQVMASLKQQAAANAVPGHGPVRVDWPAASTDLERYFTTLRSQARTLIEAGADLDEAQEKIGYAEQEHWQLFELHHKRNVIKAFTELEWE